VGRTEDREYGECERCGEAGGVMRRWGGWRCGDTRDVAFEEWSGVEETMCVCVCYLHCLWPPFVFVDSRFLP
jgi:hypothetical protein